MPTPDTDYNGNFQSKKDDNKVVLTETATEEFCPGALDGTNGNTFTDSDKFTTRYYDLAEYYDLADYNLEEGRVIICERQRETNGRSKQQQTGPRFLLNKPTGKIVARSNLPY